ncbi:MAG: hypothetical protein PHO41_02040 [Eubacteriales bacterium]|nr:hypothetical protein [Eubacteriales bacterium]
MPNRRRIIVLVSIAVVAVCAVLALCFFTKPRQESMALPSPAAEPNAVATAAAPTPTAEATSMPVLVETGSYVSRHCVYMNPLSSVFPTDDSGYRYEIGPDSLTVVRKEAPEDSTTVSDITWDWQPFSNAEWNNLFILPEMAPDISQIPEGERRVAVLSPRYRLFEMRGEYWLMQVSSDPKQNEYAWSIFAITKDTAAADTATPNA